MTDGMMYESRPRYRLKRMQAKQLSPVNLMPSMAIFVCCAWGDPSVAASTQDSVQAQLSPWFQDLPVDVQSSVLWFGDMEEGTLFDWTFEGFRYGGGGVFNTGGDDVSARVVPAVAHSGGYAVEATIRRAFRSQNGDRAVRLMRWTNTAWDNDGQYFPTEAYFSVWMYFPERYNPNKYDPWDPGDGGWWNILQFKSDDQSGTSQPIWVLNVDHDDDTEEMFFYLYTKYNTPASYGQRNRRAIPPRTWVHVEAYYAQAPNSGGSIAIWQDGELILSVENVTTKLVEPVHWGIGNYTDHIAGGDVEGEATIYFDDAAVSTLPLHPYR